MEVAVHRDAFGAGALDGLDLAADQRAAHRAAASAMPPSVMSIGSR